MYIYIYRYYSPLYIPWSRSACFNDWIDRFQDASKTAKITAKTQDVRKRLSNASKTPKNSSKTAKTSPSGLQTPPIRPISLSRPSDMFASCHKKLLPKPGSCQVFANFQNTPQMFVRDGQARWTTATPAAVNQGWPGGGSPA